MPVKDKTLVARVARLLAELSMEHEDGGYIGAEDDLLKRLGVSRPTLRQAAKIAENERMISVRRGLRGGFYAARPAVGDAIRQLNRFLRLQGAGLQDLRIMSDLHVGAARLAAACTDEAKRDQLFDLMDEASRCDTAQDMMTTDTRFMEHVAAMSGNPVAELWTGMSYAFGWTEQGVLLYDSETQRAEGKRYYHDIGTAILAGDGDLAAFHMHRRLMTIQRWIDIASTSKFGPAEQF